MCFSFFFISALDVVCCLQIGVVAAILVVANVLQLWSKSNAMDVTFYAMANQVRLVLVNRLLLLSVVC